MNTTSVAGFDIPDDDAQIARALEDASIPTLMMSIIHMTGDTSLLDGPVRPAGVYINEYQGYMSDEDKALVRAQALEHLVRVVVGKASSESDQLHTAIPIPSGNLVCNVFGALDQIDDEQVIANSLTPILT